MCNILNNMAKSSKSMEVQGIEIALKQVDGEDYISLTDMCNAKGGNTKSGAIIHNWMRRRDTLEYLATWESIYNKDFNVLEFEYIRNNSGTNRFVISVKEWVDKTNAIGIRSIAGRYGGTYAHRDIAFNFGMWLSPQFQLYVVKEYQRLKSIEQNSLNLEWEARRELSKTNYRIHTDAVKEHIIPKIKTPKSAWKYAEEADLINLALFGTTAKEWSENNPIRVLQGENIRDSASINELIVLSNLESYNAQMIKEGIQKEERGEKLYSMAQSQLKSLEESSKIKSLKKLTETTYLEENENKNT